MNLNKFNKFNKFNNIIDSKYNTFIKIIIIILIILLFINLTKILDIKNNNKENYDGRILNITKIEDCADIASSIYDVSAFSYSEDDKTCFISKTLLTRPPIQVHPYHNDFKITDKICNKMNYIRHSEDIKSDNNLISNRIYSCYTNTDDNVDQYYFEKNKPSQIILNTTDLEKLSITSHDLFSIDWPNEKSELNDINVKYKVDATKANITKDIDAITWIPAVIVKEPVKNVYDVYNDKYNNKLFKLKKTICIEKLLN